MSDLNLSNLILNKNEILKSEIGALLFNLGKTHAGVGNWKTYFQNVTPLFSSYKDYYQQNHFENELVNTDNRLKDFIFNGKVKLPDGSQIDWKEFFFGDVSSEDFIRKVFFRGCENINSGIDKGSPKEDNKLQELYISNAFGSFKYKPKKDDFDKSRLWFLQNLHRFLKYNNYYYSPEWNSIRGFVLENVARWYSSLLSDSRFSVNDVTLWDQAYMTASMFKATLSGLFLDNSNFQNYINNPQTIKWSILGIQYDKLSLSEKGLKAATIKWYRERSKEIDNKIKRLLEIDYPIGNEVYRDETGIYFVVSENLIGDKSDGFYKLHTDLNEIKNKIQEIFRKHFQGEVYPAIILTEPSRGLMNLGHLIEKANENFLKAEIPNDFEEDFKKQFDSEPEGVCQVCKLRLANKENKDDLICDVCKKRMEGRIDEWIKNIDKETIWLDELQDKNGRVALITLKFELDRWINGDMVNSLEIRNENYKYLIKIIKKLLTEVSSLLNFSYASNFYSNHKKELEEFLKLFDKNGIQKPFKSILSDKTLKKILGQPSKNLKEHEIELKSLLWRGIYNFLSLINKNIENLNEYLENIHSNPNFDNNEERYKNNSFVQDNNILNYFKDIFCIGFIYLQVKNIILERSIGSKWEEFIKSKLGNKIDFENRTINWQNLTDSQIQFLSELILQFLLRKNPSPARLKRIWETTKEFFEDLESKVVELSRIKEERQKRLVWSNVKILDGEYCDGDILFWAKSGNVYLITSFEKIGDKKEFKLKKHGKKNSKIVAVLQKVDSLEQAYKPYFTILSPTPISWQFIIPAENVPELIKNIQEEYYKNFKWVYGKLPLHVGVIIQNYKRPLYVGIKALRKIRRDGTEWFELRSELSAKEFKARQKKAFNYQQTPEQISDCENFYSLFEKTTGEGRYEFYLYPDKGEKQKIDAIKEPIDITQNSTDADRFYFYSNTFDFEFLDTNTRRNDIFYKKARRFLKLKQNRPYDMETWQYFEKFKDYFKDNTSSSKLQKLISLIHSKLEDWNVWENLENALQFQNFVISSFVNILELKDEAKKNKFSAILGLDNFNSFKNLSPDEFIEKILMFIDMFEFWHTGLKI